MKEKNYDPESYWNEVAQHINVREDLKIIAGDDEPYYRHKRKLFLKLFNTIAFENKKVLEVGSGPGGNLEYLSGKNCKEIAGVDISAKMVELSKKYLQNKNIQIQKIDGIALPFDDNYFDLVFTSTVLQHNTDQILLDKLITNICKVSNSEVIIFERIEKDIKGHSSNIGRPVEYYSSLFKKNGFELIDTRFLKIQVSYYVCGIIRKFFNRSDRKEGEQTTRISRLLQTIILPVTQLIDKIVPSKRDLGMLRFKKSIY